MLSQIVSTVGLAFDIAGAIWVVKSMLRVKDDELAAAADRTSVWAGPAVAGVPQNSPRPALMRMFRESRRDARIGASLLVIGFLGQVIGVWIR